MERSYQVIYPNLYVILVGPQGNRKTAAKDIAQDLLRSIGGVQFSCEATTREFLIEQMEKNEVTFMYENVLHSYLATMICVTEFKEFLAIDPARIINFLTAVYDQNFFDYGTKGKGVNVLKNPCLNMLACETPEWITERLKDKIVSGGFSRRVLYVHETDHSRLRVEKLPPECIEARKRCVEWGKKLQHLHGRYVLTPEGNEFYWDWYLNHKIPQEKASMVGYYESKHTLLLKVAMLLAAAESMELVITPLHLAKVLELLEIVEANMGRVFAAGGRNELGNAIEKAHEFLKKSKGLVKEKEVEVFIWNDCRDKRERQEVFEQLMRAHRAARYSTKSGIPLLIAWENLPEADRAKILQAESQQSSEPVVLTMLGSSPSVGPPSSPPSAPALKEPQSQESQSDAPPVSSSDKAPPPSEALPDAQGG